MELKEKKENKSKQCAFRIENSIHERMLALEHINWTGQIRLMILEVLEKYENNKGR